MARVHYPAGRYTITETITVPSGALFEGDGHDTVFVATGDFPAITVVDTDDSGTANTTLRNFSVERTNTLGSVGEAQTSSDGVLWLGSDGVVENVWIRDCYVGVRTSDGAVTSDRLTLRNVRSTHSNATANTSLYGFQFDGVRYLRVDDCVASGHWFDGLKVRKNCRNVLVTGGRYHDNGASGAGDGIDAYSGGQLLRILGAVCEDNDGGGINVKSGGLTAEPVGASAFGYVRSVDVAHCTCRGNTGIGLDLNRNTAANPTSEPLVHAVTVTGCVLEDNTLAGLNVRARNVSVTGCVVRGNGAATHGAVVATEAVDVTVSGCVFAGNGGGTAGTANLYVAGTRVQVVGCVFAGKDADTVTADSDHAGLSADAAYGVLVAGTASSVLIRDPRGHGHGTRLVDAQTTVSGAVLVHSSGSGSPEGEVIGSVGSTFTRTDGTANTCFYVKGTAATADVKTGWAPLTGA